MKSVRIVSFSGPCFSLFSECGKIRTRKTLNTDTFHALFGSCFLNRKTLERVFSLKDCIAIAIFSFGLSNSLFKNPYEID